MIEWKRHINKLIYNFTSRGFTFLLLAAFSFIYTLFRFFQMTESEAATKKFMFDGTQYVFILAGLFFLGKTGYEKWLDKKQTQL